MADKFYKGPMVRKKVDAPRDEAFQLQRRGELELAKLKQDMSFQKLNQGRRQVNVGGGVIIECNSVYGQDDVRVVAPFPVIPVKKPKKKPEEIEPETDEKCWCGDYFGECIVQSLCVVWEFNDPWEWNFNTTTPNWAGHDMPAEMYAVRVCIRDEDGGTDFSNFMIYGVTPSDFTRYYPGDRVLLTYCNHRGWGTEPGNHPHCAVNGMFKVEYDKMIEMGWDHRTAERQVFINSRINCPFLLPLQLVDDEHPELRKGKVKSSCIQVPIEDVRSNRLYPRFAYKSIPNYSLVSAPVSWGQTGSLKACIAPIKGDRDFQSIYTSNEVYGDGFIADTTMSSAREILFSNMPGNNGPAGCSWLNPVNRCGSNAEYFRLQGIRSANIGGEIPSSAEYTLSVEGVDVQFSIVCFNCGMLIVGPMGDTGYTHKVQTSSSSTIYISVAQRPYPGKLYARQATLVYNLAGAYSGINVSSGFLCNEGLVNDVRVLELTGLVTKFYEIVDSYKNHVQSYKETSLNDVTVIHGVASNPFYKPRSTEGTYNNALYIYYSKVRTMMYRAFGLAWAPVAGKRNYSYTSSGGFVKYYSPYNGNEVDLTDWASQGVHYQQTRSDPQSLKGKATPAWTSNQTYHGPTLPVTLGVEREITTTIYGFRPGLETLEISDSDSLSQNYMEYNNGYVDNNPGGLFFEYHKGAYPCEGQKEV